MKKHLFLLLLFFISSMFLMGCRKSVSTAASLSSSPDLVIYTSQDEKVYSPIIKEFHERTGYLVHVENYSSDELLAKIKKEKDQPFCDLVFGMNVELLETAKELWNNYESSEVSGINSLFSSDDYSWTGFSVIPIVIMYNTKVVTYRELPTGWKSLLDPRWMGRIAFVSPDSSDIYASSLVTALSVNEESYLTSFIECLNGKLLSSVSEVNSAIQEGRYSLGITLEDSAQTLVNEEADVAFLYPKEGTSFILEGTSIVNNAKHFEVAAQFIDFTISKDVQRTLVFQMNRRSIRSDLVPPNSLPDIVSIPLIDDTSDNLQELKSEVLDLWDKYYNKLEVE